MFYPIQRTVNLRFNKLLEGQVVPTNTGLFKKLRNQRYYDIARDKKEYRSIMYVLLYNPLNRVALEIT